MNHKLIDIPLEQLAAEHYLFDLEYPVKKVSEILDVDENRIKEIYENYAKLTIPWRKQNEESNEGADHQMA